jgi:ABC-2 type transport system permease protein
LIVVGTAELASDLLVQLATRPGGEVHRGDLQLLQNLIDWSVEDTDLLTIRSTGAFARTLIPLSDTEIRFWEMGSYGACAVLLALGTIVPRRRGRQVPPLAKAADDDAGQSQ